VGYWSFNEGTSTKATDFSGNGNHGTYSDGGGGLPAWVNGKRGKAIDFFGDDYVDAGSASSLRLTSAMTACAWVKPTSLSAANTIIARGASSGGTDEVLYGLGADSTGKVYFFWTADGEADEESYTTDNSVVTNGQWVHLCAVRVSLSSVLIYANGASQSVTPSGDSAVTTVSGMTAIGREGQNDNWFWPGVLDEVRVYNRALSASEITALYAGGTSGAARANASSVTLQNGTTLGPSGGLVGHWTFDGADVANVVYDRSGQNNNGYFIGGATELWPKVGDGRNR
jgi:hypothetical protein